MEQGDGGFPEVGQEACLRSCRVGCFGNTRKLADLPINVGKIEILQSVLGPSAGNRERDRPAGWLDRRRNACGSRGSLTRACLKPCAETAKPRTEPSATRSRPPTSRGPANWCLRRRTLAPAAGQPPELRCTWPVGRVHQAAVLRVVDLRTGTRRRRRRRRAERPTWWSSSPPAERPAGGRPPAWAPQDDAACGDGPAARPDATAFGADRRGAVELVRRIACWTDELGGTAAGNPGGAGCSPRRRRPSHCFWHCSRVRTAPPWSGNSATSPRGSWSQRLIMANGGRNTRGSGFRRQAPSRTPPGLSERTIRATPSCEPTGSTVLNRIVRPALWEAAAKLDRRQGPLGRLRGPPPAVDQVDPGRSAAKGSRRRNWAISSCASSASSTWATRASN